MKKIIISFPTDRFMDEIKAKCNYFELMYEEVQE